MVPSLSGLVVVVAVAAGPDTGAAAVRVANALHRGGAVVGVLTDDRDAADQLSESADVVLWRVDPTVRDVWPRVLAHIEQRLGPIDAVVTDRVVEPAIPESVRDDFRSRGHGGVVVLPPDGDPVSAVLLQVRTPR